MFRGGHYLWGVIQVENENHRDFVKLQDMLLCTNMEDLKEQTRSRHYERYGCSKLLTVCFTDVGPDNQPVRWRKKC
nr:septin-14-like [Dasypus novemcinctus]